MLQRRVLWVPEQLAGRGGLGEVWAARDGTSGLRVAMKILPGLSGAGAPAFLDEVRAAAALHHPNVVRVFDLGVVGPEQADASGGAFPMGAPFLVMEWAGGGTLEAPASWVELRGVLRVLLSALAHAHARGVLHRDIKPANVLVGAPGDMRPGLKLVDFGLARLPGAHRTSSGGTPAYMAPEQIEGGAEGPWTDLYALGGMAWRLVTGHHPFVGDSVEELAHARLVGVLPPFEPRIEVPQGFDGWLARLLARWPVQRFRFAADALRELDRLGTPVAPRARLAPDRLHVEETVGFDAPSLPGGGRFREAAVVMEPPPAPLPRVEVPPTWTARPVEPGWSGVAGLRLFGLREIPLVGRVAERDRLWSALREVAEHGRPRVVIVRGPAGVGKSCLARWLVEEVHAHGAALPLSCAAGRPPARDHVLAALVSRAANLPDDPDARARAVERHPEAEALERASSPTERLSVRIAAATRVLRAAGGDRPVVVWIDDAAWSATGLALAQALVRHAEAGPILAVLTVQEEALPDHPVERAALERLQQRRNVMVLDVGPLPDGDLAAFVDALLPLEPVTARFVLRSASGSPLLAQHLVRAWIAGGSLVATPRGLAVVASAEQVALEDLLAVELEAVLDGATDTEAEALERAAVLGDAVHAAEWAAACAVDGLPLPLGLVERLLDRGVVRRGPDGITFAQGVFRAALVRRAGRAGRERAHHAAAARALDGNPHAAARIGEHWLAAAEPERALGPLLAEAQAQRDRFAITAVGVLLRAVRTALDGARVPRDDARWGTYLALRMWLDCVATSPADGAAAARELVTWAEAAGDEALAIRGRCRGILCREQLGEPLDPVAELEPQYARAAALDAPGLFREVADYYAIALRNRGSLEDASAVARALLAYGEARGDTPVLGSAWRHLGVFARMRSRREESMRCFEAALPRLAPDTWEHAETLNNLGDLLREMGRHADAVANFERAAALFATMGSFDVAVPLVNIGLTRIEEGRMDEADAVLQRGVLLLAHSEQRLMEAIARAARLAPLAHRGDRAAFAAELAAARPVLDSTRYVDPDVARVLERATVAARARGWEEAGVLAEWAAAQWAALGREADAERVRRL